MHGYIAVQLPKQERDIVEWRTSGEAGGYPPYLLNATFVSIASLRDGWLACRLWRVVTVAQQLPPACPCLVVA